MTSSTPARRIGQRALAAVLLAFVLIAGCTTDDTETTAENGEEGPYNIGEPIEDSTYAVIVTSDYGADTLTTSYFQTQFNQIVQQNPALRTDNTQQRMLRRQIVEDFVMRHLVEGEAESLGIEADTGMVSRQVAQLRARFPNQAAFDSALTAQGFTMDSLRSAIGEQVKLQMYQQQVAEGAETPTAAAIDSFRQAQAREVRAQHILFLTQNLGSQEKDSIQQVARVVLDSVKSGVDFAEFARRHSDDGSAQEGGDLGYFSRGQMVPPFEEAVFSMADSGDVYPELVETRFGYHIIRLTGQRTTDPMDSTRAAMMLAQQEQQETVRAALDSLRAGATVRLNPSIVDVDLNEGVEVDPAGT